MGCQRQGPKPALGVESEKELHEAAVKLQKIGHGISQEKFCDLLARLILRIKQKISKMTCLLKGVQNLSLRHPGNMSITRANMTAEGVKGEFSRSSVK
jgi:hypothetical protein